MNYAAYGLGQGFANNSNNNSIINAMNTASLIQYRRDQQRLQNRYADIAQQNADLAADQWSMEKQSLQLALDEQKLKFEQYQKQSEGKEFVQILYGGLLSGDMRVVNSKMQSLKYVKQLADEANVISFDPISSYSDKSLQALGYSSDMNPKEYLVANLADGTKELINAQALSAKLGMGNYYTQEQLQQVFGNTTLKNLQEVSKLPLNDEGEQQATTIANIQNSAERIVDNKVDTEGKSVVRPTEFEMKTQGKNLVQYYIDNFDNFTQEQYKDMINALGGGDTSQQVTLGEKILDSLVKNNPEASIEELKNNSEFRQAYQYLENSLTKTQVDALKKAREEDSKDNILIGKYKSLVEDKGLKILADKTFWQQGSDWFRKQATRFTSGFVKIDDQETQQKFQSLFNTLLKISSGQAVTLTEADRKYLELGNLKDQNAVTAMIGLRDLAEDILERKKTRSNQTIISKYDNMETVKNLESYIGQLNKQLDEYKTSKNVNSQEKNAQSRIQKMNPTESMDEIFNSIVGGN